MNLESFAEVLWRQRVVVASVLLIGLVAFGFAISRGPKYSASSVILAGGVQTSNSAVLDPTKDPIESAISPTDLPTLLHSSTVMKRVAEELHLSPKRAAKLDGNVKAKVAGTDAIPITVTDTDPNIAMAEANALARELQHFEQQIAESRYALLIHDLRGQLTQERTTLSSVDDRIAALTSADPYVTYENGTSAINVRLVALEGQRDTIQTQLLGDSAALATESERPAITRDLAGKEIIENDPVMQSLRTQYGKDLALYNVENASYKSTFPGLSGAEDAVRREGAALDAATADATKKLDLSPAYVAAELDRNKAGATFESDRAQLASLNQQIDAATAQLGRSRVANVSLSALKRERQAGEQTFAELSDRLALAIADQSQAASVNSIVILDNAVSASPTMLSRPPVLFAGILVIFSWLAITLAFIADRSDGRLRTRTTIEELYGSPVLSNVT